MSEGGAASAEAPPVQTAFWKRDRGGVGTLVPTAPLVLELAALCASPESFARSYLRERCRRPLSGSVDVPVVHDGARLVGHGPPSSWAPGVAQRVAARGRDSGCRRTPSWSEPSTLGSPWGELRRTLARHRHRRRMLAVALSTSYVPTPRTASLRAAVRLPSQSARRCCALPEDDIEAARRALERTLLLDSTSTPEEQPEPEAPKSSSDALDFTEPSTDTSRSGPFRFAEPEPRPGPVIDDIDAGLAEVQDFGERVGGLAWLGATFWLQLPGIQYFVLGAFLLFGALVAGGSFGGAPNRFLASAPQAYEGAYYSYRYASPGVTDESAYVMDDPVQ